MKQIVALRIFMYALGLKRIFDLLSVKEAEALLNDIRDLLTKAGEKDAVQKVKQ